MPQMFGTITVSDGISMGTEGMKYSLVSREVIADCIETAVNGQSMDGAARHRRLRQEHARRHDRHGPPERPRRSSSTAARSSRASSAPGPDRGVRLRGGGPVQRPAASTSRSSRAIEQNACPGAGCCGGMYTANTMSSAFEALGLSLPYSSTMAAEDAEKTAAPPAAPRCC